MQVTVLCDFDGTIALQDTADLVLSAYADPQWEVIEAQWKAGQIGSAECMRRQFELIDASSTEIDALLDGVEVDPFFRQFAHFCEAQKIPLTVASDGVDYFIKRILARADLGHLPVRANHLVKVDERHYTLSPPQDGAGCRSRSGVCKCALAQHAPATSTTLLIGDGRSDFCLAHEVDLVIAKKSLLNYCIEQSLPHVPFADFSEAQRAVEALLVVPRAAAHEQAAIQFAL